MKQRLSNAAAGLGVSLFAFILQISPTLAGTLFDGFAGDYVVVAVRQNSFVAASSSLRPDNTESPIGKKISINSSGLVLDGIACQDWQVKTIEAPVDFSEDAMLSDLRLPPMDSPISVGDKRLSKFYQINCEGETFTTLYQLDNRVLAMSWANSQKYLILERPLSAARIEKLQKVLKSMKFYSGTVTGQFDKETEHAVRAWYSYRMTDRNAAIPRRPAITENLLDALKVLN